MPGTQSTPKTKRELVALLNTNTMGWETVRERPGRWHAITKRRRSSATNERQAMENLCKRLGLL
jgi:hypothetical protein